MRRSAMGVTSRSLMFSARVTAFTTCSSMSIRASSTDAAADEDAAKSLAGGRFFNAGPFALFPPQEQIPGFNLPGDVNQPLTDAQRAILRSIGGQFVQH